MEPLIRAKEIADNILQMTKVIALTGDKDFEADEIEAYITLLEEREPLIDELSDLRQQIDEAEASSPQFKAATKTIAEIVNLDKKHMAIMEQKHKEAKGAYKEIKQGQRIHAGYNPLLGNEVSSKLDIKQ